MSDLPHTMTQNEDDLVKYVMSHLEPWKQHRVSNYDAKWDEYERLYRAVWAQEDKQRDSERAKVVSPAIQQAVDSRIAEISEAVLSRNEFFDLEDDTDDPTKEDVGYLRRKMGQAFKKDKIRKSIHDVIQLGEIYGTGVGEIIVGKTKEQRPDKQQMTPEFAAVGVRVSDRLSVRLHPVHPRNFIPEPNVDDLDDMLGYGIEEKVPLSKIVAAMATKEYKLYSLQDGSLDDDINPDSIAIPYKEGGVRVFRWYGKVPRDLLENKDKQPEPETLDDELSEAIENLGRTRYSEYSDMVEAIIHIAEGSHLLKAEASPYMMGDRCCLAYRPQTLAGRFWGIGTVEKGYSMQKSLDGQIRSHLDGIALTAAPMVGIDAAKLPRGFKFSIHPGKTVLTNGNPAEIIQPLNLGQPNPINIETAQLFERFLQQATGTVDSAGMPSQVNNQTDSGAMSMALSGIIKKHKQALLNFQEDFLIPFIQRSAWRFMQYDPDNFPVKDWNFVPASTMGIMAREYEQQQLVGLMQTLGPESKIVPLLLKGIIENSSLSNREDLAKQLEEMSKPSEEEQQAQQQQMQLQMQTGMAQMALLQAQAQEAQAKAVAAQADAMYNQARAEAVPMEVQAKLAAALSNNLDEDDENGDFLRRAKITELMLKEKDLDLKDKDIDSNERISLMQTNASESGVAGKLMEKLEELFQSEEELIYDDDGNITGKRRKKKPDTAQESGVATQFMSKLDDLFHTNEDIVYDADGNITGKRRAQS